MLRLIFTLFAGAALLLGAGLWFGGAPSSPERLGAEPAAAPARVATTVAPPEAEPAVAEPVEEQVVAEPEEQVVPEPVEGRVVASPVKERSVAEPEKRTVAEPVEERTLAPPAPFVEGPAEPAVEDAPSGLLEVADDAPSGLLEVADDASSGPSLEVAAATPDPEQGARLIRRMLALYQRVGPSE